MKHDDSSNSPVSYEALRKEAQIQGQCFDEKFIKKTFADIRLGQYLHFFIVILSFAFALIMASHNQLMAAAAPVFTFVTLAAIGLVVRRKKF